MYDILNTVAFNKKNGTRTLAKDAVKGIDYSCICGTDVILHKSGKTGSGSKRPHFEHKTLNPKCNPDRVLHDNFRDFLLEKLQQHLSTQTPVHFSWSCKYCSKIHEGNLLKRIESVKKEYYLKSCQPDIALLNSKNDVIAVIEIVVYHEPEEKVLKYYKDNKIILTQINLKSDEDLENIDSIISRPDIVDCCLTKKCEVCGKFLSTRELCIVEYKCPKCQTNLKIAIILQDSEDIDRYIDPRKFKQIEIDYSRNLGANFESIPIKGETQKYFVNKCPKCKFYTGYSDISSILSEVNTNKLLCSKYVMSYYCDHNFFKNYSHLNGYVKSYFLDWDNKVLISSGFGSFQNLYKIVMDLFILDYRCYNPDIILLPSKSDYPFNLSDILTKLDKMGLDGSGILKDISDDFGFLIKNENKMHDLYKHLIPFEKPMIKYIDTHNL